ncbi:hypothetical protein ES706_06587 [subsurface metagenome]
MNKVAIIIVSLILAVAMGLGGCVTISPPVAEPMPEPTPPAPAPAPPLTPAPPETSSTPGYPEILTESYIRAQITLLDWPTEAHIGEYITVRIRTGSDEFWAQLEQEVIDIGEYESIWLDPYYSLYLMPERGLIPCVVIGIAEPDENHEVWWYGSIPASAEGEPIELGTWKLIVEIGNPLGSVDTMVERNIIIKE